MEEGRVDLDVGACLSGKRPGAEGAARRKGRSELFRRCGLRGLRATSRSFALGFGFRISMAVFGPDAGDPNEPWAQRVNPGLTLPVSHVPLAAALTVAGVCLLYPSISPCGLLTLL